MCLESQSLSVDHNAPLLRVSVVICGYTVERLGDIHQAVKSVIDQTYSLSEIVVAVDHNPELFERLKAELPRSVTVVLSTEATGLSGTRNHAIRSTTGDIIAFMDDDAMAKEDWLEQLVKHYGDTSVLAVGGKTIALWETSRPCWFAEELDWTVGGTYKGVPQTGGQVRNLWGGNMSFRKEVFQQVGLFRTDLGRTGSSGEGEDTEFCMRIGNSIPEATILYEPSAVMYHKVPRHRASLKYVIRRSFDGGLSLAKIRRSQSPRSRAPLSTESTYLRYLLTTALLERIRRLYKPQAIAQIGAIAISVCATGMGYLVGRVRGLKKG